MKIEYRYYLDALLESVLKGDAKKSSWEKEGKPSVYVVVTIIDASGKKSYETLNISLDDICEFSGEDIDMSDTEKIVKVFEDMLSIENYVENVYLFKE